MLHYGIEIIADEAPAAAAPDSFKLELVALNVAIADRDRDLLIVRTEAERDAILRLSDDCGLDCEPFELLRLPPGAEATPLFDDYGFVSESGAAYLYAHLCAVFRFAASGKDAEPRQAEEQMQEHLLARFGSDGDTSYAVDRSLNELMLGIAKAYKCKLAFTYGML